jgi:hypothetical protein
MRLHLYYTRSDWSIQHEKPYPGPPQNAEKRILERVTTVSAGFLPQNRALNDFGEGAGGGGLVGTNLGVSISGIYSKLLFAAMRPYGIILKDAHAGASLLVTRSIEARRNEVATPGK